MAGNNAGFDVLPERDIAIRELEEAKAKYLACEPLLLRMKQFLDRKRGVLLDEQEHNVRVLLTKIEPKVQQLRGMNNNAPENHRPEASFKLLIQDFREVEPIPLAFLERKQELVDLSLQICKILDGAEFRLGSVIDVVPIQALNEIFGELISAFGRLQEILADVLRALRGENDGSTIPSKMLEWTDITCKVILFLADVYLKLYWFGIDDDLLGTVNGLLSRVMLVNNSEKVMGILKVVGETGEATRFREQIAGHQLEIGILLNDIKNLIDFD